MRIIFRTCVDCRTQKPTNRFYPSKSVSGRLPYCIECTSGRRKRKKQNQPNLIPRTELYYDRRMKANHPVLIKFVTGAWPA